MADENTTDFWESTRTPLTPEETAANLNLTDAPLIEDIVPQSAEVAAAQAGFEASIKAVAEKENNGWFTGEHTVVGDALSNTVPGLAIQYLNRPAFEPDPAFTEKLFEERQKSVMETLPEEYWGEFDNAVSNDHFDYLYAKAKENFDRVERLNNNGWGPWGAMILAQVADPTNWVVGGQMFRGARMIGEAAELGKWGQRGLNAGVGGAHSLGYVGAQDYFGAAPSTDEYAMAAGLGLFFGGVIGPVSKNPALREVAKDMADKGQAAIKTAKEAVKTKVKPPGPTAVNNAAEASAEAATPPKSVEVIADPPTPATPEAPIPGSQAPAAAEAPVEGAFNWRRTSMQGILMKGGSRKDVEAILAGVPDDQLADLMVAQRVAVDPMTPPARMRNAIADAIEERVQGRFAAASDTKRGSGASSVEDKFKGISSAADDVAEEAPAPAPKTRMVDLEELEATPALRSNPRFVAAYRAKAGVEYRILAETSDMSGPYKVVRVGEDGKLTNVGKGIDDIGEARLHIPRDEIPETPAATPKPVENVDDALELPNAGIDDATLRARIDALREELRTADPETAQQIEDAIRFIQDQADEAPANNSTTGAAATPAGVAHRPDFFEPGSPWHGVRDDNVAKPAFAEARVDRSGWLGKTRNAAARLIGNHLFNNTVGMADHSVAQRTADLAKDQAVRIALTPYNQARKAQFPIWARAMGYTRLNRWMHNSQFAEHIATAIRNEMELPANLPAEARTAATRVAEAARQFHKDALEDMKNPLRREGKTARPLPEADRVADNDSYLWRKYLPERVSAFVEQFGTENLERLFHGAIQRAQPDIPDHYLTRLARGFARNLTQRAYGVGDEWTIAMREGDRARFARLLREDAAFTDQEIDHVMSVLWDARPDPRSGFQHLKHRVLMDEYWPDAAGRRVVDLLDNNADRLMATYANRVYGRVALAKMQVYAPSRPRFRSVMERTPDGRTIVRQEPDGMEGGALLVDGLRTDAEIEGLFENIRRWSATAQNRSATAGEAIEGLAEETERNIDMLRFAIDRLLAKPDPKQQTRFAQVLRNTRDFHFMRLMWQGGAAQLGETGSYIGTLGTRAVFSQVPGFRRIIDTATGRSRLAAPLFDELEAMGIGVERLHGIAVHHMEHLDDLPFTPRSESFHNRVTNWLQTGTKITNEGSLMGWITQMQERQAAAAVAQKIANIGDRLQRGGKLTAGETKRLSQLSLSDESLQRIFANMRQHVDRTDGVLFKKKLARLNVNRWDLQTRAEFEAALFKMTKKLVQTGDLGNTAFWMSDPVAQTFFQFRNFTFTAWQNSTLYNAHIRDPQAMASMLWSMGWAAAVRGAQVKLIASLMPNGREYEEKYGSMDALARAGFQRSGFASVLPMMMDTALLMAGQKGMFDARNTDQPSDVFGTPSVSFYNTLSQGVGGGVDSLIRGRPMSQAEIIAFQRSLPMGTFVPLSAALSQLIKNRPKRAPQRQQLFGD